MIIAKFRIYFEIKNQYYLVNIHDSYKSVKQQNSYIAENCKGLSSPEKHYNNEMKILPCIGQIHLIKGYVTTEIVSHEIAHALFYWLRRRKININNKSTNNHFCSNEEERAAYAFGKLMAQFNHHAHRLKIWS